MIVGRRAAVALPAAFAVGVACATGEAPGPLPYEPTRDDYRAFARDQSELYEPNYLPFMLHQRAEGEGRATLFVCRWPASAMPLRVSVVLDAIPDALQSEFHPREPDGYREAVRDALEVWERELEGHVRFEGVALGEAADIRVRLRAERAPVPDGEKQVLGVAELGGGCTAEAGGDEAGPLAVRIEPAQIEIFLADAHGLLASDQVHRVALHELGHALGMRGHSPIPADLMYSVARDRLQVADGLSGQDVNSFLSLYRLPKGTVFARLPRTPSSELATPSPVLDVAPHVDARHGFRLRLPRAWTRFSTAHGVVAVDGVTWDYDASLQVAVQRYATIDAFLERYGGYYLARGAVSAPERISVDGRRAVRSEILLRDAPRAERVTLIEVGDGRVIVVTEDAPAERMQLHRPVFDQVLASLRIRDHPEDAWPSRR